MEECSVKYDLQPMLGSLESDRPVQELQGMSRQQQHPSALRRSQWYMAGCQHVNPCGSGLSILGELQIIIKAFFPSSAQLVLQSAVSFSQPETLTATEENNCVASTEKIMSVSFQSLMVDTCHCQRVRVCGELNTLNTGNEGFNHVHLFSLTNGKDSNIIIV